MVLSNKNRVRNRATGIATLLVGLLAAGTVQAADFDCKLATTKIEKLICSDATVSQLDADLGVAYRNRDLWDYNKLNYWYLGDDRHENIGSYNKWKTGYKAAQRRWLKEVRNACTRPGSSMTFGTACDRTVTMLTSGGGGAGGASDAQAVSNKANAATLALAKERARLIRTPE